VIITKHGRPAAVVISVEDLQSLEETLDIMNSAALLADTRESLAELSAGGTDMLAEDEALWMTPAGDVPRPRVPHRLDRRVAPGAVQASGARRAATIEFFYGSLAESPRQAGQPLRLGQPGLHSARRGDYRVIYRVDDGRRLVTVIAVEHRSDVYRPRQGE
jgi:mRNA interferase RelE/StbE